jgi:signal transduction histidine kinase
MKTTKRPILFPANPPMSAPRTCSEYAKRGRSDLSAARVARAAVRASNTFSGVARALSRGHPEADNQGMRWLRLALWPATVAVTGLLPWLLVASDDKPGDAFAAFATLIFASFAASGLVAWTRRPDNRVGPLMVLVGYAWAFQLLQYSNASIPATAGVTGEALYIAIFAHLVLAFPTGRLDSRLVRWVVGIAYVDVTVGRLVSLLFDSTVREDSTPANAVLITPSNELDVAFANVCRGIGILLSVVAVAILAHRWRNGSAPYRRTVAPVLWTGGAAFAMGALALVNESLGEPLGDLFIPFCVAFAILPLAFLAGLLRQRLDRAAVAPLVMELRAGHGSDEVRLALARALHDPELALAYWLPDERRYVDADGRPVELPPDGEARVTRLVEADGRPVAALVIDASLQEDAELVDAVCAAAAFALENERLHAELRARLEELRASRARIVEAADAERRRIERNLHDGTQQRLVSISMALGLAEARLASDPEAVAGVLREARESLGEALQELRELSQGIHPGLLSERGLGPALHELAYRAPVPVQIDVGLESRLPEPVEAAAYYLVAEALANVAKHSSATGASVSVARHNGLAVVAIDDDGQGGADPARGSGLRGLADRVEALGGRLEVASGNGGGTRIRAEIPCG